MKIVCICHCLSCSYETTHIGSLWNWTQATLFCISLSEMYRHCYLVFSEFLYCVQCSPLIRASSVVWGLIFLGSMFLAAHSIVSVKKPVCCTGPQLQFWAWLSKWKANNPVATAELFLSPSLQWDKDPFTHLTDEVFMRNEVIWPRPHT